MIADSLRYTLAYDAAAAGYTDWWFPGAGVAILAFLGARHYYGVRYRCPLRQAWTFYAGIPFVLVWTVIAAGMSYSSYASLRDRLRLGQFTLVEGVVQDFQASDFRDQTPERWAVASGGQLYHYEYVRSRLTPGFRHEAVHGGPIRPGLRVRIADIDGHIARLELVDSTHSARAPNEH